MLAISLSINIIWVPFIMLLSAMTGFAFRSHQIKKLNKQVNSLEKEMLFSHAEILNLQEEMVRAKSKNPNTKSLVVSMKEVPPAEESIDHHSDISNRKKFK